MIDRPTEGQETNEAHHILDGLKNSLLAEKTLKRGISDVVEKVRESADQWPPPRFRNPLSLTADSLAKAEACHKIESRSDIERPTWSVLNCLDVEGGACFAPAVSRALFELEQAGNPLVDELLEGQLHWMGDQSKSEAVEFLTVVQKELTNLRSSVTN